MISNIRLSSDEGPLPKDVSAYRRLIGRLLYLIISWPDITFAIYKLSQYVFKPRKPHLDAVHHLLGYIKASPRQGLFFLPFLPFNFKLFLMLIGHLAWTLEDLLLVFVYSSVTR